MDELLVLLEVELLVEYFILELWELSVELDELVQWSTLEVSSDIIILLLLLIPTHSLVQ